MLSLLTRTTQSVSRALSKEDNDQLAAAKSWKKRNRGSNLLHYLAERGDGRLLRLESRKGDHRIEEKNVLGFTPLHIAVLNGHFDAFQSLLKLGSDPNTTSYTGNSVLATATTKWLAGTDSDQGRKFCWMLLEEGAVS